jgi:hypothetical protein
MPSDWELVDLLTRKIKLRCIKRTFIGTVSDSVADVVMSSL